MENDLNLLILYREIDWLEEVIDGVIRSYFQHEDAGDGFPDHPPPDLEGWDTPFTQKAREWELDPFGRLALALTLAPHLRPESLDIFFAKNELFDRGFTEFGGVIDQGHSGFLPTGQTLIFLATALHPEFRPAVTATFGESHPLVREQVLHLASSDDYLPTYNGVFSMSHEWVHYFLTGETLELPHSESFPATRIHTKMEWEDIVLEHHVMEQVLEIDVWMKYGDQIMRDWGLDKMIKPGYRALFYGPPGTGKTLTASVLGKSANRPVYRIDLSMIVSKYIGETEKNLARIFDIASHKNWILFFDEADALFGKRTEAKSSNDRHANQQTAYLLQRIEDFPGVVILATNLKANMDEAFTRRFQAMIHFAMPGPDNRFRLWQNAFSGKCTLDPEIDLWKIAEDHELAGGAIINVLRFCALAAIRRDRTVVTHEELMTGLRREFKKDNKTLVLR